MESIGWAFPLTGGGREDGYNDPGMAHFDGSPLGSLARETIQNSLDAKDGLADRVEVVFDVVKVQGEKLGQAQLADHVRRCLRVVSGGYNPKAMQELETALELLSIDQITFLRVADYNTLGLDDARWKALVKSQGLSHKTHRSAGGSHGIGKYAPFVVSQLRTVFYWSEYNATAYCQGKAVLMSHDGPGGRTQGTGFFGIQQGCKHLSDEQIPKEIDAIEKRRAAGGTSLWIAGFADAPGWQMHIARSVAENYFCAIADDQLEVFIEPGQRDTMFEHWEINRETLPRVFKGLLDAQTPDDDESIRDAFAFYGVLYDGESILKEMEDVDLGHCRLWIRVADGMPCKVGLVRKTGMLITAKQNRLIRFRGLQDFAAVLRFESEKGNELLRDMENPAHSQFEPDRLDEARRRRGARALNRVIDWVKRELQEAAAPPKTGAVEIVSELAHLLPDLEPDESFGEDNGTDLGFGTRDVISLRPTRRSPNASLPDETSDDAGNDLDSEGGSAGLGPGNGSGGGGNGSHGETDESGTAGGGRARREVTIKDFRLLPTGDDGIHIAFTPIESAKAVRLRLREAGDSTTVARSDLRVVTPQGLASLADLRFDFVPEQRIVLRVKGDKPLDHRAWSLQALL